MWLAQQVPCKLVYLQSLSSPLNLCANQTQLEAFWRSLAATWSDQDSRVYRSTAATTMRPLSCPPSLSAQFRLLDRLCNNELHALSGWNRTY